MYLKGSFAVKNNLQQWQKLKYRDKIEGKDTGIP